MKVIFNTTPLTQPLTGIGRYTYHIVSELLDHPEVTDIRGLSATGILDKKALRQKLSQLNNTAPASFLARVSTQLPGTKLARTLLTHYHAVRHASELEQWVYWEPSLALLPLKSPSVATVYDCSHIRHPEYHPARRVWLLNYIVPKTLTRADRILTISYFTLSELNTLYQLKQPVDIAYPGVSPDFYNIQKDEIQKCRNKYCLPKDFILSVGTLEPRKNLTGLIEAFKQLPSSCRQKFPLVIAGGKGWQDSAIKDAISQLTVAGEALVLGYVDQADIPALYASASLTAYLSHYEGFGMPVAESMAAATPVLTSNITAMPEVAANCAVTANPSNVNDICEKLKNILDDQNLRMSLAQKGKKRALLFSWKNATDILVESMRKIEKP